MSERFYINCPLQVGAVTLEGPEAHHLATVSRFRPGDAICLFNGDGQEYPALVGAIQRRRADIEITEVCALSRELPFEVELAAPLPKGDRAQFLIEKLTELGVTRFVPLQSARSIISPRDAKLEKLHRHVIEACKQCGRNVLMQIAPLTEWESYCRTADSARRRYLGDVGGQAKLVSLIPNQALAVNKCCAVGPEGGFTAEEVQLALAAGWQAVHLGPRTLRIETAALLLAAAATIE